MASSNTTPTRSPRALTTTFTPPENCATQFMLLEVRSSEIWLNPRSPASGITPTSCHPREFVSNSLAFSPLVCPLDYTTARAFESPSGYIACCPSGFDGVSIRGDAVNRRPASGAVCYTNIDGAGLLVTHFGLSRALATSIWIPTGTGAQAFAHVYDGFALAAVETSASTHATTNSEGPESTGSTDSTTNTRLEVLPSSSTTTDFQREPPADSSSLGGGAIAGIVIGAIAGVAILAGIFFFFFAQRRKARADGNVVSELPGAEVGQKTAPADTGVQFTREVDAAPRISELHETQRPAELSASDDTLVQR